MKSIKLAALAILTISTAPAAADEYDYYSYGGDWSGIYAGAQVGASIAGSQDTVASETYFDGTNYGLHVGLMQDVGPLVLGAEIDREKIGVDTKPIGNASASGEDDWMMTRIKMRAGMGVGDFLPYFTTGVARLKSSDGKTDGAFVGLGTAYQVSDRFSLGAEVVGHRFKNLYDEDEDALLTGSASIRASYHF